MWLLITPLLLNPNIRRYSGSMTHQIGAVQGAARENTSHLSTLQTTRSTAGSGVLRVPSNGHWMSCRTAHMGFCHHLVGKGHIAMFYLSFYGQQSERPWGDVSLWAMSSAIRRHCWHVWDLSMSVIWIINHRIRITLSGDQLEKKQTHVFDSNSLYLI